MAEISTDQTTFNGDFEVKYIKLFSYRYPLNIDISNLFSSMEIYESVYSPFMTVKLTIIDGTGILSKTRIVGDEFIEIDIRGSDGETGIKGQQFYIYKMSDRIPVADRSVAYTLHCISLEALADINTKISKSFKGQPAAIAETLFKDYLLASKPLDIEETKNSIEYISNYWSPVRNLAFLCDRAVSKISNAPAFVFYETKKSFIFTSLDRLKEQPSSSAYFYSFNTHDPLRAASRMSIIEKMYVDENFDYFKRIASGAMGNRSLIVNPMTKSYTYGYYDVISSFDEFARLNDQPFSSIDTPRRMNSYFHSRIAPTSAFKSMPSEKVKEWFPKRVTEGASIESQSIEIEVTGKFNIYAGNITSIYVYSEPATESDDMYSSLDTVFSGRYMIMSICHFIDRERHSMTMQLNKDSLLNYERIVDESEPEPTNPQPAS